MLTLATQDQAERRETTSRAIGGPVVGGPDPINSDTENVSQEDDRGEDTGYRLVCKDVHQSSVGSKKWVGEVHSEPHPKQKSCMKPHTIHHKVAII